MPLIANAFLLVLTLFANASYALPYEDCDGSLQKPCLIIDTHENTQEIKRLRDTQMILNAYEGNKQGLEHLWLSGSGAPSEAGFQALAEKIKVLTNGSAKRLVDLDLRQETHGYVNGDAINLTANYNWINRGKTPEQIFAEEKNWLSQLTTYAVLNNVLTSKQFKRGELHGGITLPVKTIESEQALAERAGFDYVRLTVSDHMAPHTGQVDSFIFLISSLSPDTWLHIHCRGGAGRTTTFMAMYDMLLNADKVSFDEIIKRQASVYPYYNLAKVIHKDPVLNVYYQKRYDFLKAFYAYATARLNGYSTTWQNWKKEHGA